MVDTDFHSVLEAFDSIVSRQLLAWVERRALGMQTGVLPESGVISKMAGVVPLLGLLDGFERGMKPEDWFSDRLSDTPPRPQEPEIPKCRRYPKGSLAAELEERMHQQDILRYWKRIERWKEEERWWLDNLQDFPRRVAKAAEYRRWQSDMRVIQTARKKVTLWESRLNEATKSGEWDFLPPGPGMEYSIEWVKIRLHQRFSATAFDFERIATLLSFQPEVLHFRSGDFNNGYIAFVFTNGRVALESPIVGNALYLFHRDWLDLSLKPKGVLRRMMKDGDGRMTRYFHSDGGNLRTWLDVHLRGLA